MKIICIGRNYSDYINELNNKVPSEPVFFLKPDTAILRRNRPFYIPDFSNDVHYEVELVLRLKKVGKNIQKKFAESYIAEIGVGIDFTARDIQQKCKEKGLPWEIAKSFDNSAAINEFIDKREFEDINNIDFHLDINGETVQQANSSEMIFPTTKIINYISGFITLKIGDLIFTGTPAGVGSVNNGDRLEAYIGERKLLDFRIK